MDGKRIERAAESGPAEGAIGSTIAERNDDELGLDNEAIGDGTLANRGQCRASAPRKMKNIPLVISDPFYKSPEQKWSFVNKTNKNYCDNCKTNISLVFVASGEPADISPSIIPRISLCESCGLAYVQSLAKRNQLVYSAGWRPNEPHLIQQRRYRVVGQVGTNETRIEVVDVGNNRNTPSSMSVRTDLIPLSARVAQSEFVIKGTPLEIQIFENSIQLHSTH